MRLIRPRASGGIGRRAGFRILWTQVRGGSSPPSPTCRLHVFVTTVLNWLRVMFGEQSLDNVIDSEYNIWRTTWWRFNMIIVKGFVHEAFRDGRW